MSINPEQFTSIDRWAILTAGFAAIAICWTLIGVFSRMEGVHVPTLIVVSLVLLMIACGIAAALIVWVL